MKIKNCLNESIILCLLSMVQRFLKKPSLRTMNSRFEYSEQKYKEFLYYFLKVLTIVSWMLSKVIELFFNFKVSNSTPPFVYLPLNHPFPP